MEGHVSYERNKGFLAEEIKRMLIKARFMAEQLAFSEIPGLAETAQYVSSHTKDCVKALEEVIDAYHASCALDASRGHDVDGIQY